MAIETLERRSRLDLICRQIFCLDDRIDLVAIVNHRGRVETLAARDDGVNKDLTAHKREMLFMGCALQASMQEEYDDEFGKVRVSMVQREKVLSFTFLLDDYFMLVISKLIPDPLVIQQKVISIIFNCVLTN